MQGIGYKGVRKLLSEAGVPGGKMETDEYAEYLVYFARGHVVDHETGIESRGPLKIGRAKYKTALMRGRNQPGVDFRVYAEILVPDDYWSRQAEDIVGKLVRQHKVAGPQCQTELYAIPDNQLRNTVDFISDRFDTMQLPYTKVNFYGDF